MISGVKSLKKVWNEQKKLKTAEKSISTSFQVHAAPESWLKYTTPPCQWIPFQAAGKFSTLKKILKDLGAENINLETKIPLPNIRSLVLKKLVQWATHHSKVPGSKPEKMKPTFAAWDKDFIETDPDLVLDIVTAADYLDNPNLLDLGCMHIGCLLQGQTVQEIRQMFKLGMEADQDG